MTSSINVYVRTRPLNSDNDGLRIIQTEEENKKVAISKLEKYGATLQSEKGQRHEYVFDDVFSETDTQQAVYERTAKKCVDDVLFLEKNVSIIAYGATGAGKTFTMTGTETNPGLIPRVIKDIFAKIANKNFQVKISYMEIYNETIRDLLNNASVNASNLNPCEVGSEGEVKVLGLTERVAINEQETMKMIDEGIRKRKTESTGANEASSRSHSILQLEITNNNTFPLPSKKKTSLKPKKSTKLFLIDLAGSERASNTNNRGVRLREGAAINKSLLALANCINALSEGNERVKYRDSKLTLILKNSLEGGARVVMIANISPGNRSYEETHNTLKYASRTKSIKATIVSSSSSSITPKKVTDENRKEESEKKNSLKAVIAKLEDEKLELVTSLQEALSTIEILKKELKKKQEFENNKENIVLLKKRESASIIEKNETTNKRTRLRKPSLI